MAASIEVRRILDTEWKTYKTLRLTALKLAPNAYGTTYSNVASLPDTEWQERVRTFAHDPSIINLLAFMDGRAVGMVSCYIKDKAEMVQMWTDPAVRGKGVGKLLVQKLKTWVRETGYDTLYASVFKTNSTALALYERQGFVRIGESEEPDDPASAEYHLSCSC